ncbi:TrmH family RNA methyltransferase [Flexithrix dorotheae]|uniref:TrmH family RNA methyltransferase n=1 Tax=Flexithrix dorotheae TaxID=70993 RepID=UPI00035C283D|nr:TrmH family RNA methyltransferase [Flexithrix dorotheae]
MIFNTVLLNVQSPKNVGMIIRSHVAFNGNKIVFVGYDKPWNFKHGSQAFSRKLESKCDILNFKEESEFFEWSKKNELLNLAIEIDESATNITEYEFQHNCNLILGSEGKGIEKEFLQKCDDVLFIPQFGTVECLNVSISASIAQFEFCRHQNYPVNSISGSTFKVENQASSPNS